MSRLVAEQVEYYRARADEYDTTSPTRDEDGFPALVAALDHVAPRGRVLELACGTGIWTAELARHASALTAVDAAPEMIELNRAKVRRPDIEYVVADLFDWHPRARYDVVFLAAWLSHVPPQRFASFWAMIDDALAPGGTVIIVDELPAVATVERVVTDAPAPAVERQLRSGQRFRTVKVLYAPEHLIAELSALGWAADVRAVNWRFFFATVVRSDGVCNSREDPTT